jgi:hypothetical protein
MLAPDTPADARLEGLDAAACVVTRSFPTDAEIAGFASS